MSSGWTDTHTGSNSFYTSMFDGIFGYRAPPSTPTTWPTMCACQCICSCWREEVESVRCSPQPSIDPLELEHATCLMDEQLLLIEQYFISNGIGQTDAQAVKDEALTFLQANAINDDGWNPDLINWFGSSVSNIYIEFDYFMTQRFAVPCGSTSHIVDLIRQPGFMTLLSQLQLMSDIGNPSNMDSLDKDQFKTIDWNSVIPSGTTTDTFDEAAILSAAENAIVNAGGTVPSDLESSISRTADDAQSGFFDFMKTGTTTIASITPTPITHHTPAPPIPTTPTPAPSTTLAPPTFVQTATTTSMFILDLDFTPILPVVTTASTTTTKQTTVENGSGSGNSNGFGNGINNSNGLGSMFGDPHIRIKNPNEPAICFDIEGQSFENSQIIQYTLQECIWISLTF